MGVRRCVGVVFFIVVALVAPPDIVAAKDDEIEYYYYGEIFSKMVFKIVDHGKFCSETPLGFKMGDFVVSDGVVDVTTSSEPSTPETTTLELLTTLVTSTASSLASTFPTVLNGSSSSSTASSTRFPRPKNWVAPNTTRDMEAGTAVQLPEQTVFGVVCCVSVGVLIVMLYMAVFGQRIRSTAIRWHVINCSIWGILHLVSYASFADKAPWPQYIKNEDWTATKKQVECFTRSVFPAGMVFVYLEAMVLTCAPKLANNIFFNFIFFLLLVPFLNGLMIFCYAAHFMTYKWFYEPIDLFNLVTYVLFCIMTFVYVIWCLIGSCMCCAMASSKHSSSSGRSLGTFLDMWMMAPYGVVPSIMYGPSFGMTSIGFAMKHLLVWLTKTGLLDGPGAGGNMDLSLVFELMTNALLALPWFVLLFPLVQSVLTVVCIRCFREQFFFTVSCGRIYEGPKAKVGAHNMKLQLENGLGAPPSYPLGTPKSA
ncbi:unnamed protein product [Caenorhabditis auriculariae]|uniref:Uncharacterized protein n=1 Tax=Caenorhabditis auriculariae TaxID=2777116 RepID=A0A8S1HSG8_9PELO|nr:unnamed protein product [Caenorhabditis auriculariae]